MTCFRHLMLAVLTSFSLWACSDVPSTGDVSSTGPRVDGTASVDSIPDLRSVDQLHPDAWAGDDLPRRQNDSAGNVDAATADFLPVDAGIPARATCLRNATAAKFALGR